MRATGRPARAAAACKMPPPIVLPSTAAGTFALPICLGLEVWNPAAVEPKALRLFCGAPHTASLLRPGRFIVFIILSILYYSLRPKYLRSFFKTCLTVRFIKKI
jgi:hypothetical protein